MFTHLIGMKLNFVLHRNIKSAVKKDFKKLQYCYDVYQGYEGYKRNPEIYFIQYLFWNIKGKKAIEDHKTTFKELFKIANTNPIIQYYLFIGPEDKWKKIFNERVNQFQELFSQNIHVVYFL